MKGTRSQRDHLSRPVTDATAGSGFRSSLDHPHRAWLAHRTRLCFKIMEDHFLGRLHPKSETDDLAGSRPRRLVIEWVTRP